MNQSDGFFKKTLVVQKAKAKIKLLNRTGVENIEI